ncbi:MAG: septum formation initiator family protein [Synergistaceae bacterium]|nr:septum formation initiator family protein [Synergistaceae bacterium]
MPSLKQLIFFALALIGLAITLSYYRFELDRIAEIRGQIAKSEAVLKQKREAVRDYKEKVEFYKTQEGIEHLAREQYNLIGNNERVILLKSPDNEPSQLGQ